MYKGDKWRLACMTVCTYMGRKCVTRGSLTIKPFSFLSSEGYSETLRQLRHHGLTPHLKREDNGSQWYGSRVIYLSKLLKHHMHKKLGHLCIRWAFLQHRCACIYLHAFELRVNWTASVKKAKMAQDVSLRLSFSQLLITSKPNFTLTWPRFSVGSRSAESSGTSQKSKLVR